MIFLLTQMLCNFPTDGQFYIPIDPYKEFLCQGCCKFRTKKNQS
jgi:hypothetical protein